MELSIILVSYNTSKITLNCIKSIINSNLGNKYEIIVVDNASTDGSVEAIEELLQQFAKASHKISIKNENGIAQVRINSRTAPLRLIKNQTNFGFAKANNQGLKVARGKYILLLNSDTLVEKAEIEKLLNFASHTPDAGAVVPKLVNFDRSVQGSIFRFPTIGRAIRQYWLKEQGILDKYSPVSSQPTPVEVEAAVMAAFLITPQAISLVGLLDERFFIYYEDIDYCRRIKNAGLKVYYLPDSEVIHYHGVSGKSLAALKDQWKRLIPSSKIYHGIIRHYIFNFIIANINLFK